VHEAGDLLKILGCSFLFLPQHHADDRFPTKLLSLTNIEQYIWLKMFVEIA
jgi:hypothetical protein